MKLFKNFTWKNYAWLGIGLACIVAVLIFFPIDRSLYGTDMHFNDFSQLTLIFLLSAGALAILQAFLPLPFLSIAPSILIGCGVGSHLYIACYPLADITEPVAFFTNDVDRARKMVNLFIPFLVIFALLGILTIVLNFLSTKKKA